MKLAPRLAKRRNETRDLTRPLEAALNKLDGVRVWRNNVGTLEWQPGKRLSYGLGVGSADLVGLVLSPGALLGRFFALECKLQGEHATDDQERWLGVVRSLGGFAAVVHSIEDGVACVDRCRSGRD